MIFDGIEMNETKQLPAIVSTLASQLILSSFTTTTTSTSTPTNTTTTTSATNRVGPQISLSVPKTSNAKLTPDIKLDIKLPGNIKVKKTPTASSTTPTKTAAAATTTAIVPAAQSKPRLTIKHVDVENSNKAPSATGRHSTSNSAPANSANPASIGHQQQVGQSGKLIDIGRKLLEASRAGRTSEVRRLVVSNGAPFVSDWLGTTALHLAAQNGHFEITEILLKGGVNKDARTKLERTPLHLACQAGHLEVVDLLVESGCDVNAEDMLMMTPIHWAVEREHLVVVERLLTGGADLTSRNKFDLTPIDIAQNIPNYAILGLFEKWLGIGHAANGNGRRDSVKIGGANSNDYISTASFICPHEHFNSAAKNINNNNIIDSLMNSAYTVANSVVGNQTNNNTNNDNNNQSVDISNNVPNSATNSGNHNYHHHRPHHTNYVFDESNDDMLDLDYHLALIDTASTSHNSALDGVENPCLDLVEFEWDRLEDLDPDLFIATEGGDESAAEQKVEYLMKIVEGLQQENQQLRQQVEQLTSPSQADEAIEGI